MAESFDPFDINISNSPLDPLKTDAEDNHEVSQIEAALAGVASTDFTAIEGWIAPSEAVKASLITTDGAR